MSSRLAIASALSIMAMATMTVLATAPAAGSAFAARPTLGIAAPQVPGLVEASAGN